LLSLASMILGSPSVAASLTIVGETGVDEHAGILLRYPGRGVASLVCSVRGHTQRGATIVGTAGQIRIHEPIICPGSLTLYQYPDQNGHHKDSGEWRYLQIKPAIVHYLKQSRFA